MSTNYYWHYPGYEATCSHCGQPRAEKAPHIGLSATGQVFALRVGLTIPVDGQPRAVNTLEDWQQAWTQGTIRDDSNRVITPERMLELVTRRSPARTASKLDLPRDPAWDPRVGLYRVHKKFWPGFDCASNAEEIRALVMAAEPTTYDLCDYKFS
jgi:hypothetical protein